MQQLPSSNLKSPFLKSLQERGFINQITHLEELDELMLNQKIAAYIGFDCTAKSLHIGSLIQIMVLRHLQANGHQAIVLLGDGTTKIGDPSGKDEARQFLSDEQIKENCEGIKKTLQKFDLTVVPSEGLETSQLKPFLFVNNNDWLKDLGYIDFLRDIGKHFSVNKMLSFDSVKLRLERQQPLSFIEFNYMLLQSYDFYHLNKNYNCVLQIGGSDQWGNIVSGVDLTRRIFAIQNEKIDGKMAETFGLTTPLLTTFDGKKMGKTAQGAIWLDEKMLSPFDYYQYFRNVDDKDVSRFLRFFTDANLDQIAEVKKMEINSRKEVLARDATEICHKGQGEMCYLRSRGIFSGDISGDCSELPTKNIQFNATEIENGKKLTEILKELQLCGSIGEAKRLIKGGGVKVNGNKIADENYLITRNYYFNKSGANLKPSGEYREMQVFSENWSPEEKIYLFGPHFESQTRHFYRASGKNYDFKKYFEAQSYYFHLALGKKKFFKIQVEVK